MLSVIYAERSLRSESPTPIPVRVFVLDQLIGAPQQRLEVERPFPAPQLP
jgi:hypothetical protein